MAGSPEAWLAGRAARTPRRVWLMLVVAAAFTAALTAPYVLLNVDDSRVTGLDEAHYAVLVAHIFPAGIALVLGPLQFVPAVRARRRIHRTIGRVYLFAGVVPAALAAVPVALLSGHVLTEASLTVAAILWLITAGVAYRAARRGEYARHQDWMTRNYALTFLAVTSRVFVPLLLVGRILLAGASARSVGHDATAMIPVGQTLGWLVDLLVAEVIIRRRRRRRRPAEPAGAADVRGDAASRQ